MGRRKGVDDKSTGVSWTPKNLLYNRQGTIQGSGDEKVTFGTTLGTQTEVRLRRRRSEDPNGLGPCKSIFTVRGYSGPLDEIQENN